MSSKTGLRFAGIITSIYLGAFLYGIFSKDWEIAQKAFAGLGGWAVVYWLVSEIEEGRIEGTRQGDRK